MISTPCKRIVYLGLPYRGSTHDFSMLKDEFTPAAGDWFLDKQVWVDLGYQGFDKNYLIKDLQIPTKRPRRKNKNDPKIEFTEEQKMHNKSVGSNRIYVEHAIGGMKRFNFLSGQLRCRDLRFYSIVMGVCAGIWNFQLTY